MSRRASPPCRPNRADARRSTASTWRPELSISRVVTGLWQIADMERGGRTLDLDAAARAMQPYIDAGFTSFDMADHYGSAELIAGRARPHESEGGRHVQLFTKWVPPPGPVIGRRRARRGGPLARAAARAGHRPAAVPRLELRRPGVARRALPPARPAARGADPLPRPDQRRRRAPAAGADQRHPDRLEPGERVAHRSARLGRAGGRVPGVRRVAAGLRHAVRRLAQRSLAGRGRARLGAPGHLVADEVRPLHPRRRRLAGAAAGAAGGARGRRSPRRVDRQRRHPVRDAAAGRGRGDRRRAAGRAIAHRRQRAAGRARRWTRTIACGSRRRSRR